MNLKTIYPFKQEGEDYTFIAVFTDCPDTPEKRVQLAPGHLLSYSAFQERVLLATGVLWANFAIEGRPVDDADRVWRELVQIELCRNAPKGSQAGNMN
jgi:hypothetical protein